MSNLFPLSVVKITGSDSNNPTCAEILNRVKDLKGFIGPNLLYEAEVHKELLHRVSCCFKDIVKNVNISLSIPKFMKSEAVLKNINCKKDLQKLQDLCAHHLKNTKETPQQKILSTSNLSEENDFTEMYDAKLLDATELVTRSKPLMEELNKKVYLSKCGKSLIQKFQDITKSANVSFIDVFDHNKRRSIALKRKALHDIMKYDSFTGEKEEKKPTELFLIRQEYLRTQITERLARTKEYERMSELESALHKTDREFLVAFDKMTHECKKNIPKITRQKEDIKRLEEIYQAIVKRNIVTDNKLIRDKTKLLTQLANWVKKYDTDVALKMYTLNMVKGELREQQDIFDNFLKEYNRLSEEYSEVVQYRLVEARLEEYRIEVAEKKAAKEKRGRK